MRGVHHGDLKAENVMVSNELVCKLIDFGFSAKVRRSRADASAEARVKLADGRELSTRTKMYFAPEVRRSDAASVAKRDPYKIDVWGCGTVLMNLTCLPYLPLVITSWRRGVPAGCEIGFPDVGLREFMAKHPLLRHRLGSEGAPDPRPDSSSLRDLLFGMLAENPSERLSMEQVMRHPWTCGADLPGNVERDLSVGAATEHRHDVCATKFEGGGRLEEEIAGLRKGADDATLTFLRLVSDGGHIPRDSTAALEHLLSAATAVLENVRLSKSRPPERTLERLLTTAQALSDEQRRRGGTRSRSTRGSERAAAADATGGAGGAGEPGTASSSGGGGGGGESANGGRREGWEERPRSAVTKARHGFRETAPASHGR